MFGTTCCLQVKDQLMAVGRARQNGIEVPGLGVMSAGRFEEHAGSKLHRPNQHTFVPSGKSLQVTLHDHSTCKLLYPKLRCVDRLFGATEKSVGEMCSNVFVHLCGARCNLLHAGHHGRFLH